VIRPQLTASRCRFLLLSEQFETLTCENVSCPRRFRSGLAKNRELTLVNTCAFSVASLLDLSERDFAGVILLLQLGIFGFGSDEDRSARICVFPQR
jgi:hypothetical protein